MTHARPIEPGTKNGTSHRVKLDVLPPVQAGLSAALRRAFPAPADADDRLFADLLKQLV